MESSLKSYIVLPFTIVGWLLIKWVILWIICLFYKSITSKWSVTKVVSSENLKGIAALSNTLPLSCRLFKMDKSLSMSSLRLSWRMTNCSWKKLNKEIWRILFRVSLQLKMWYFMMLFHFRNIFQVELVFRAWMFIESLVVLTS